MYHIISIIFILLLISACVNQPPAPIEYNNNKISISKPSSNANQYSEKTAPIVNNSDQIVARSLTIDEREDFAQPVGTLKVPANGEEMVILPQPTKDDNVKIIYHEVQEGETIELIAENYNQTVEEIEQLNDLTPPYDLPALQLIKIKLSGELLNKKNKQQAGNLLREQNSVSTLGQTQQDKFIKPVEGKIITRFGDQTFNGKSNGIKIKSELGNDIKSIAAGVVVYCGHDSKFGNMVIVKLDYGDLYVAYAHMQELMLKKGIAIKQGELIGHIGDTGVVDSPGLYLAIREGKVAVNPLKYISM